jgi:pyoverdine/dityrosine biosynthesis protein Dit1
VEKNMVKIAGNDIAPLMKVMVLFFMTHLMYADNFQQLVERSKIFNDTIGAFSTKNNRMVHFGGSDTARQKKIVEHAQKTQILLYPDVRRFLANFLKQKNHYGSKVEKALYKNMNVAAIKIFEPADHCFFSIFLSKCFMSLSNIAFYRSWR